MLSSVLLTTGLLSLWSKDRLEQESQISKLAGSENAKGSSNGRGYYYLPPLPKTKANSSGKGKP